MGNKEGWVGDEDLGIGNLYMIFDLDYYYFG